MNRQNQIQFRRGVHQQNLWAIGLLLSAATAAFLLAPIGPVSAATRDWIAGDDFWNVDGNWNPAHVPLANDSVNLTNNDGVSRTITYDYNGPGIQLNLLTIGLTGGGPGDTETLLMTANNLNGNEMDIGAAAGAASNGTFTQSGGNSVFGGLYMGKYTGNTGFFNLSDSGSLVTHGYEYIGISGAATFTQTGGTHTNDADHNDRSINIGLFSGSTGAYILTAGTLNYGAQEWIGIEGVGTFTQSGGTHNMTGGTSLYLGYSNGGNGAYTLSGGSLSGSGGNEYVGFVSTGAFNQTGGVNTGILELNIGTNPGATGCYALGGNGVIIARTETVGDGGAGTFDQTGGANNITNTNNIPIGLKVGSAGGYSLSGGSVNIAGSVGGTYVSGVLNVSGTGVLTEAGTLQIIPVGAAALNLSGGVINTGALNLNGAPAHFNWTGGTLNVTANVTWDAAAAGNTTGSAFGSALTLSAGQTLMVTGNEMLSGGGGFSLLIDTGGAHYVTGALTLNATGVITQNPGSSLYAATLTQAGGVVNGTLQNQGVFNYQSGQFNGRLLNQGTVNLGPNFIAAGGVENDTSMTLAAGQSVSANGAGFDNLGLLVVSGGALSGDGPVVNEFGATIQGHGNINPPISNYGTLSASGVLAAAGGTTNFGLVQGNGSITGGFNNDVIGTVSVANGNSLAITADWGSAGLISLEGPTARLGGGAIANSGTIQGVGIINSAVANSGTIEALGGTLTVAGALTNPAGGLLTAGAGSKLLVTAGLATNDGIVNLTGGTFDNNNHPLDNNGEISGWGIFRTGGAGLDNHGSITLTGGATTVNGPVTNEDGQTITVAYNPATFTGLVTNGAAPGSSATFITTNTTATFASGFTNNGDSEFVAQGNGVIQVNLAPKLGAASQLSVHDTSKLKFKVTSGAATVGVGVTATVADAATLELAGSVPALSAGANRVNIRNDSSAAAGLLVSGTHQIVGGIDGSGNTVLSPGSDLTADHINQASLLIGAGARFTIAPSSADGSSLAVADLSPDGSSSSLTVARSLTPSSSFIALRAKLLHVGSASSTPSAFIGSDSGSSASAVPEPSSLLLLGLGALALSALELRKRRAE